MPDETLADAPGIRTPFPRFWLLSSAAVVLAGALTIGIRTLERPANPLDEFLPLVAAERVLAGDVPYRDYTTLYPPLMTLLDAALLSVAAPELLLARALFLAIVLAGLLAVTRIAARIARDERIAAGVGLLAAAAHGAPLWGYALVPAIVLVLWSFLATLRARAAGVERPRAWLALAGVLLGLASLARHDAAAWGAIPIVAGVFFAERARGGRAALASAATVLGTAAIFPLAFLVFLVAEGALGCAWEQLVRIPAVLYPEIRGLPWPRPWRAPGDTEGWPAIFSIYAPFVVGAIALAKTVVRARSGPRVGDARLALLDGAMASVLPLVFLLSAAVRPVHSHVYAA